uniref:Uncharacterized protein n=1 Tax=Micrurus corallinus TaxID=54390 RepID=A0A2D4F5X3_MICCO
MSLSPLHKRRPRKTTAKAKDLYMLARMPGHKHLKKDVTEISSSSLLSDRCCLLFGKKEGSKGSHPLQYSPTGLTTYGWHEVQSNPSSAACSTSSSLKRLSHTACIHLRKTESSSTCTPVFVDAANVKCQT